MPTINKQKIISNQDFFNELLNLKGSRIHVQNMVKTNPEGKDICVATYHLTIEDISNEDPYIFILAKEKHTDLRFAKKYIKVQKYEEHSQFSVTFVDENSFQIVNLFYNCDKFLNS